MITIFCPFVHCYSIVSIIAFNIIKSPIKGFESCPTPPTSRERKKQSRERCCYHISIFGRYKRHVIGSQCQCYFNVQRFRYQKSSATSKLIRSFVLGCTKEICAAWRKSRVPAIPYISSPTMGAFSPSS